MINIGYIWKKLFWETVLVLCCYVMQVYDITEEDHKCLNIFCGAYLELNLKQASTISKTSRLWFWTCKNWSACFEHTVFQLLLSCLSNFSVFEFLSLLSKNFRLQHWKTYQRLLKLFWYCKIINQKLVLVQYQYLFQSYLRNKFSERSKSFSKLSYDFWKFHDILWYFTRKGFQLPYVDKLLCGFSFNYHTWTNSCVDLVSRILWVS